MTAGEWATVLIVLVLPLTTALAATAAERMRAGRTKTGPAIPPASPRAALLEELLRERFVVTLDTGESFAGLLLDVDDRSVVLGQVTLLRESQAPTEVQGELVLERRRVCYLQKV